MHEFRKDDVATARARKRGQITHPDSYISNSGHIFLFGADRSAQRRRVIEAMGSRCRTCGTVRSDFGIDYCHGGKTPRTRCDCFRRRLNDGTMHTNVYLQCSTRLPLEVSCHRKEHNREIKSGKVKS